MGLIQFGSTAAPSFDDPIAMLMACHDKIRRFLDELALLPDYIARHGWDDSAWVSVQRISQYFNQAAPLHHQDEEEDLFPAYGAVAPAADLATIKQLTYAHTELERAWHELYQHLITRPAHIDQTVLKHMLQCYQQHMQWEEPLFERAQSLLQDALLQQLGQNMAARRHQHVSSSINYQH